MMVQRGIPCFKATKHHSGHSPTMMTMRYPAKLTDGDALGIRQGVEFDG